MANKVFRWVGSGNTASSSINIFNWNQPGNWEVRTYIGQGASGGWQFIPTSFVPGPFDIATIGQPYQGNIGVSNFNTVSKVKSPCLFGGFLGTVAGGTWTNAGLCGSSGGVTYTSALKELRITNTVLWHGDTYNFDGMTYGGNYRSYNDTVYAFNNFGDQGMPLGGGLAPSIDCINNLNWVKQNYPNMGIVITPPSDGNSYSYQFTVPGYTSGAGIDALTIKCYDSISINQIGTQSTSPVDLKIVGAYVPISRNFGATGYTGINAPEVITKVLGASSQTVTIEDGMFAYAYLQPAPAVGMLTGVPFLPTISYEGNITALQFQVSCLNRTEIAHTVKFKDAFVNNSFVHQGMTTNSAYNIIDKTLDSSLARGAVIRGSQFVNDVYATLYPGNTVSNAIDIGQIIFNPTANPFRDGNGIKRSAIAPGVAQEATTLYSALKRSAATRCLEEDTESANLAMGDLMIAFPEDDAIFLNRGFAPGSHILEIGLVGVEQGSGTTLTQNIETIQVVGEYPGMETPVVNIVGNVKINDLLAEGGYISFSYHSGTARIANLRIDEKSTLDLRGGDANSNKFFGLVSSSGVCGGISNLYANSNSAVDNGGNIFLESGQRLFNVSTSKAGRLAISSGSTDALDVSDSIPPSISTKSKS